MQPSVATIMAVEGTGYVTRVDGRVGPLARGSSLGIGDVLSTARNSTVRLRFHDGGETAVRPDSRITVQAFSYVQDKPEADSLVLNLVRGGLRAITGAIGKRGNVDAYRLQVRTATIGIRGTDYIARLCEGADCGPASTAPTPANVRNSGPAVIARVLQAQGSVSVERESRPLELTQGSVLYASDRVATAPGALAVLAFRDNTRITLNSSTQLSLSQYNYNPSEPVRGNMLFHLLRGGLRVATGLIAKSAPSQVKFQTVTATIGIRGTVFDLACGRANPADDPPPDEATGVDCDQSLFASTREGRITLAGSDGREIEVDAGQSALVPGAQGSARPLGATPAFFNQLTTPAPEGVDVNLEQLFGTAPPASGAEGVYVLVREGRVVLAQEGASLVLDAGESAYAGQALSPVRLSTPPLNLDQDLALSNSALYPNMCRR